MNINQFTGLIPTSFAAIGTDPKTGAEIQGEIKIKLNRLAYDVVTQEGFAEAMQKIDKDPRIVGELLAGKTDDDGTVTQQPLLAWWELFSDDANTVMFPITCENIIKRPYDFVASLSEAVMDKLFLGPAKAGNLLAGSARKALTSSGVTEASQETPANSPDDTPSLELAASGA